jgi:hypothetical protein
VHVWTICTTAAPGSQRDGTALLVGGQYATRVYLPNRSAAHAAHAALRRVGYQASRATGGIRGRDLIVAGWSAEGLESRLTAQRAVLQKLAAEPAATAIAALDQLDRLPAAALPGLAGQRQLIVQAGQQLRAWISGTSGIHAPRDPRARPTEPGSALRLHASRRAEEAIDNLAVRHLQVAEVAVAFYPALRQRMGHDTARDSAVRRAGMAFHLSPQQLGQDLTPLLRNADRAPGPAAAQSASQPPDTSPKTRPGTESRPWLRTAQEFPAAGMPISPTSRPPSTRGATRPRGRNFPSGRPGRRR